jgi:glutamate-5-semialdehyde dehydrogenase
MSEERRFFEGEEGPEPAAIAKRAREAARRLAVLPSEKKNEILRSVADGIEANRAAILEANRADVLQLRTTFEEISFSSRSLLDRLVLDEAKVAAMAAGVRAVAALPDPVGRVLARTLLDDGLVLEKVTVPIGVLLVIFESRPDAVPQIASLALKSGNAAILKGGSESARSTAAILDVFAKAYASHAVPGGALRSVGGRSDVDPLLALDEDVDLVIPRGGYDLVRHVKANTRIPVLGHAEGVCHVYLDRSADEAMATAIVLDAKLQYPAACNAAETLLVHREAAARFLVPLLTRLAEAGIALRACERTRALAATPALSPASGEDWRAEYGGPVLAVKVVESLDEAIEHVNRYGSHHTEAIVAGDPAAAEAFLARVDAAGVFHNASTRFSDGFRYGFGAEVGVSTSRLHARGPVGLDGLVTYKYVLRGSGQVVATYSGKGARPFRHERIG